MGHRYELGSRPVVDRKIQVVSLSLVLLSVGCAPGSSWVARQDLWPRTWPDLNAAPCAFVSAGSRLDGGPKAKVRAIDGLWTNVLIHGHSCWVRFDWVGQRSVNEQVLREESKKTASVIINEASNLTGRAEYDKCEKSLAEIPTGAATTQIRAADLLAQRCRFLGAADKAKRASRLLKKIGLSARMEHCTRIAEDLHWALGLNPESWGSSEHLLLESREQCKTAAKACIAALGESLFVSVRRDSLASRGNMRAQMLQCDPSYAFMSPNTFQTRAKRQWQAAKLLGQDPRQFRYQTERVELIGTSNPSDHARLFFKRYKPGQRNDSLAWGILEYRYCGDHWAVTENFFLDEW